MGVILFSLAITFYRVRLRKNCIQKTFVITVLHINRTFLVTNNVRCFKITQSLCRAIWHKVQVAPKNSFDLPVAASLVEVVNASVAMTLARSKSSASDMANELMMKYPSVRVISPLTAVR